MNVNAQSQSAPPIGARLWSGLRLVTFSAVGFYASILFSLLALEGQRFLLWLLLASGGLLMVLFGIGKWGQWRHLIVLPSVPVCALCVPFLGQKFTDWNIEWFSSPWLCIGTNLISLSFVSAGGWLLSKRSLKTSDDVNHHNAPQWGTKLATIILGVSGCLYFGDYWICSLHGRYEPEIIGLSGVKSYGWAPRGFVHDFKWDNSRKRLFYPLWWADRTFWHRCDAADSDKYPINQVSPEEIGKVYRAWKTR